jgi:hypothetical protein
MSTTGQVLSATLVNSPIVDPKTGRLNFAALKFFQNLGETVNNSFNQQGEIIAPLSTTTTIAGRGGTLGSILANLDNAGIVIAAGIDFARAYLNKTVDHIADGATHQLAGGAAAYAALIASAPGNGQVLEFNGANWVPVSLAAGGVTQIVAGTNVTVSPLGGTGAVTVNSTAAGSSYIKGSVTVNGGGALNGTFRGTGAVAGATTAMAAIASAPSLISLCTTNPVNWAADVVSANTVEVQVTLPNIGVGWNNVTFQVVVFA